MTLSEHDRKTVLDLVERNGLRPVVDSAAAAALALLRAGRGVKDEHGEPMDPEDIETAARNLKDSLY